MHGKLIYLFKANYKLDWKELFAFSLDQLSIEFKDLCSSEEYRELQLIEFIKNVTGILLKVGFLKRERKIFFLENAFHNKSYDYKVLSINVK